MSDSQWILTKIDDNHIAHVTLNRPEKHNAINQEILDELRRTFRTLRRDRELRAVILSGNGPSFSSGFDTSMFAKTSPATLLYRLLATFTSTNWFQEPIYALRRLPVPVFAVIQGNCFGGGFQLALAADFRFTHPAARFGILESRLGLVPDLSATITLPELARIDQVKRWTMTGSVFSAEDALACGLVTEIAQDPHAAAQELATEIIARSPDATAAAKYLFQRTWSAGRYVSLTVERFAQLRLLLGKNARAAQKALATKTTPSFKPRTW